MMARHGWSFHWAQIIPGWTEAFRRFNALNLSLIIQATSSATGIMMLGKHEVLLNVRYARYVLEFEKDSPTTTGFVDCISETLC